MAKKEKKLAGSVKLHKLKQVEFLKNYPENNFSVTKTCQMIQISRGTFYNWLHTDKDFSQQFRDANTFVTDLIISGFIEGITDENLLIRARYLAIIPQRILLQAFGIDETDIDNTNIEISYKVK